MIVAAGRWVARPLCSKILDKVDGDAAAASTCCAEWASNKGRCLPANTDERRCGPDRMRTRRSLFSGVNGGAGGGRGGGGRSGDTGERGAWNNDDLRSSDLRAATMLGRMSSRGEEIDKESRARCLPSREDRGNRPSSLVGVIGLMGLRNVITSSSSPLLDQ